MLLWCDSKNGVFLGNTLSLLTLLKGGVRETRKMNGHCFALYLSLPLLVTVLFIFSADMSTTYKSSNSVCYCFMSDRQNLQSIYGQRTCYWVFQ